MFLGFDIKRFGRHLAETVAWCGTRVQGIDAGDHMWAPELRPNYLCERPTYADIRAAYTLPAGERGSYLEGPAFGDFRSPVRAEIVHRVITARAHCLSAHGQYPCE